MAHGIAGFADAIQSVDVEAKTFGVTSCASRNQVHPDGADVDPRKSSGVDANVSIVELDNVGDDVISGRKKSSLVRPGKIKHWQRRSVFVSERRNTLAVGGYSIGS